jgi:hypothetical protein
VPLVPVEQAKVQRVFQLPYLHCERWLRGVEDSCSFGKTLNSGDSQERSDLRQIYIHNEQLSR